MTPTLRAVHRRLGSPSPRRLAAVVAPCAAAVLVAVAYLGDTRLVSALSLVMSLLTLFAVAVVWYEARQARAEVRASNECTEVTYRRILAAIEVERLAAARRHARRATDDHERSR